MLVDVTEEMRNQLLKALCITHVIEAATLPPYSKPLVTQVGLECAWLCIVVVWHAEHGPTMVAVFACCDSVNVLCCC